MTWLPWLVTGLTALLLGGLLFRRPRGTAERTGTVAGGELATAGTVRVVLPSVDVSVAAPRRRSKSRTATMRDRLIQAGFYNDSLVDTLKVLRFALLGLFVVGGYLLSQLTTVSVARGLFIGITSGLAATIVPALLLDYFKTRRQRQMRRDLPDALDIIVVCLEGGLSLPAAFLRVGQELKGTHPVLEVELRILEREVQMGLSLGEAIRNLAGRFDLEELRSLATVVNQSDRYGASVSRAFRVFASGMRQQRQHQAEERAHQAAVHLILPTALLIFPAMFVVTLGPAVFRALNVLMPILRNWQVETGL